MLFSLPNLKRRSVREPDGTLTVVPNLLHGRAALGLVEQAIGVFESYVGRPRSEYDRYTLEAVMGDYRLGRCVEACLLAHYSFVQPQLDHVLSPEQMGSLSKLGIATPADLRLAMWDAANARFGGFVPPSDREEFMLGLAREWGLPADARLLGRLLALDSDPAAILTLTGEKPTGGDMIRLYNRGAVRTLLAHSTRVQFDVSLLPGPALKKLYFLAKRQGVFVDVEATSGGFGLTLYGQEQATGGADRYGRRLADVSIGLLRSLMLLPEASEMRLEGTAHLLLHDRPYRFHLTGEIMHRLGYSPQQETASGRVAESAAAYSVGPVIEAQADMGAGEPSFDSMVEARLYKEFKSLQRQGYTHGWLLQREPEPLLAPGVVLIPDFSFQRGDMHVFMEIAGFWSPSYRERKVAKLRALASTRAEKPALMLAVPQEAVPAFSGLPFPVVSYKTGVRATDLLALLDARYGQLEQRQLAGQEQLSGLQVEARKRGFVPEQEIARTLQAYTRSELLSAARALDRDDCRYVAGVGLLSMRSLEQVRVLLRDALEAASEHRIALDHATQLASQTLAVTKIDVEALVNQWPCWHIERPSLFEAYLSE